MCQLALLPRVNLALENSNTQDDRALYGAKLERTRARTP
jgi:hypothetical protein